MADQKLWSIEEIRNYIKKALGKGQADTRSLLLGDSQHGINLALKIYAALNLPDSDTSKKYGEDFRFSGHPLNIVRQLGNFHNLSMHFLALSNQTVDEKHVDQAKQKLMKFLFGSSGRQILRFVSNEQKDKEEKLKSLLFHYIGTATPGNIKDIKETYTNLITFGDSTIRLLWLWLKVKFLNFGSWWQEFSLKEKLSDALNLAGSISAKVIPTKLKEKLKALQQLLSIPVSVPVLEPSFFTPPSVKVVNFPKPTASTSGNPPPAPADLDDSKEAAPTSSPLPEPTETNPGSSSEETVPKEKDEDNGFKEVEIIEGSPTNSDSAPVSTTVDTNIALENAQKDLISIRTAVIGPAVQAATEIVEELNTTPQTLNDINNKFQKVFGNIDNIIEIVSKLPKTESQPVSAPENPTIAEAFDAEESASYVVAGTSAVAAKIAYKTVNGDQAKFDALIEVMRKQPNGLDIDEVIKHFRELKEAAAIKAFEKSISEFKDINLSDLERYLLSKTSKSSFEETVNMASRAIAFEKKITAQIAKQSILTQDDPLKGLDSDLQTKLQVVIKVKETYMEVAAQKSIEVAKNICAAIPGQRIDVINEFLERKLKETTSLGAQLIGQAARSLAKEVEAEGKNHLAHLYFSDIKNTIDLKTQEEQDKYKKEAQVKYEKTGIDSQNPTAVRDYFSVWGTCQREKLYRALARKFDRASEPLGPEERPRPPHALI